MGAVIAFLDTSGILAFLSPTDVNHDRAVGVWEQVAQDGGGLVTHNYFVLEANALVQRRLGMTAVRVLHEELLSTMAVIYIDEQMHDRAISALRTAPRGLSLVDLVSFQVMGSYKVHRAFSFDSDFTAHGFTLVP